MRAAEQDGAGASLDAAMALDLLAGLLESGQSLHSGLELLGVHLPGADPLRRVTALLHAGVDWDEAWADLEPGSDDPEHRDRADRTADRGDQQNLQDLRELGDRLRFAHVTGAPTAELLRSTAAGLRRHRRREAERRAAELATRLVLPLGLCQLPAFICLGVIPMVLALLP